MTTLVWVSCVSLVAISGCAGPNSTKSVPQATTTTSSKLEPPPARADKKKPSAPPGPHFPVEKKLIDPATQSYSATMRIDSVEGILGKNPSSKILFAVKRSLEECVLKAKIDSLWTVGLQFEIQSTGRASVRVEGAKPELVACIQEISDTLRFPVSSDTTKVAAAIMIQPSKGNARRKGILGVLDTSENNEGVYGGGTGGGIGVGIGGVGIGGGGTGWGTVGTGQYGTIGHGSGGGGNGYGSAVSNSNKARVFLGKAKFSSKKLDKNIIRRFLRRRLNSVRYCYEKALMQRPKLRGTVNAKYTIEADGTVSAASASGVHRLVSRCVTKVLRRIRYPAQPGRGKVVVRYPFQFSPSHSGVVGIAGSVPGGITGGLLGGPVGSGKTTNGVVDSRSSGPQVRAGNASVGIGRDKKVIQRVIRGELQRIRYCYESELVVRPTLQGKVTTIFLIEPDGRVSSASASGMDPIVSDCVRKVVSGLRFSKGGGVTRVKYPFTFAPAS